MMLAAPAAAKDSVRLPPLREDLELRTGSQSGGEGFEFLIYDALRHKYIQIDRATFAVLSLWKSQREPGALSEAATKSLGSPVNIKEIERLTAFLELNHLTENNPSSGWQQQSAAARRRPSLTMWLVHNYLFFKLPLVAPEPFLRATYDAVAFLYSRVVQVALVLLGLAGLYLVSREWEAFLSEARDLATLSGALSVGAVLFFVKGLHELGHAYTAIRYGCRVPTIGIAFMMMAPMLYTDVTDAWRLPNRKQRLAIDSAGIVVEIGLACIATALWVFLPDGVARHVAFLIATTSWVMSVAVNLNPFMRFDGYYILSDLLRVENLQPRSFALGIWKLREILFNVKAQCPEVMSAGLKTLLIAYAFGIWLYRLVLFTGIALLVYTYFFKVLGVILFAFEIGYFIARPLAHELTEWWKMRKQIMTTRRSLLTMSMALGVGILAVVPWSAQIQIPAVLEGNALARIYPPRAARITSIHVAAGQHVSQGDVLIKLEAPDVTHDQNVAQSRLDAVLLRLARQSADREDRSSKQVFESEQAALEMQLAGLKKQSNEMEIRSPATGVIAEFNPALHERQWIGAKDQIALIDSSDALRAVGYVSEDNLWRLERGATGRFIADVPQGAAVDVTLSEVAATGAASIEILELSSLNGGRIETHADARQKLIPATAQYLVTMHAPNGTAPPRSTVRGTVQIEARAESLFTGFYRRVLKILVRESGI